MAYNMQRIFRGATYLVTEPAPADLDISSANFVLAGAGVRRSYPLALTDGRWRYRLSPAETTMLAPGDLVSEIAWTATDGEVRIEQHLTITVQDSLTANDSITDKPQSIEQQTLTAAKNALLTASGDTALTFSTPGGQSFSFETRGDLLRFVSDLKVKVETPTVAVPLWGKL